MSQGSITQVTTDYILRDPQQNYDWKISSGFGEDTVTYDCGPIKVDIFINDGS